MKSVFKLFGILLLIAVCSALLAAMGVLIGSGAASKLLHLPSAESTAQEEAGTAQDSVSSYEEGTAGHDAAQTESEEDRPSEKYDIPEAGTELPADKGDGVIMVGDSRTVGMHDALVDEYDPFLYIGQSGEGFDWLVNEALEKMEEAIKAHPGWPVVLNLGVNDTGAVMDYITLYQSFAGRYPNTDFFFLSVNPLTKESTAVVDEQVVVFNQYLKMAFPDTYLDSYSMLKKEGFESADGVHYSDDTYRRIHQFILDELEKY